jgi:hypothetical protein
MYNDKYTKVVNEVAKDKHLHFLRRYNISTTDQIIEYMNALVKHHPSSPCCVIVLNQYRCWWAEDDIHTLFLWATGQHRCEVRHHLVR